MVTAPRFSASDSELRYRRLFEAARDGILILDPTTRRIVDVNPFLEQFLGYKRDGFLGKELFELGFLRDENANKEAFNELRENGYIRYEHLPLETKAGEHVDVEFVSNIYQEGNHKVIQCNVRDITARKRMEKALSNAGAELAKHAAQLENVVHEQTDKLTANNAKLRQSNDQLETFVHTVAHDLRAPLRTMEGFAEILVERYTPVLDERGKQYLQFIAAASQKMSHMLTDLLAFSRLSQQEIHLSPASLKSIAESALDGFAREIRSSGAIIGKLGPWPTVMCHPATLQQMLVNLVGNALKFRKDNQPPLVSLRTNQVSATITRVWVEDNGIGIAPEFHDRVFTIFNRLDTEAFAGTGVGLAIVRKGAERMGGGAGVESTLGQGSRFWIELVTAPDALPDGQA